MPESALIEKACWERGCACYDHRFDECVEVVLKPEPVIREWKTLTTAEVKTLWNLTKKPTEFAEMIMAKMREKNYD